MTDLVSATLSGITLGLAAGMAPGPLMALAITQTIRHGSKEGIYVACAPLLTDIPIVLGLFFLLRDLPETVLGVLGLIGACYALFLAYETARTTALGDIDTAPAAASLRKGILTNFLSPHPYLFWITVGVPFVLGAAQTSVTAPWGFIIGFYLLLVGSKAGVATLVGHYRLLLTGRAYPFVMRGLALALVVFALLLFREGVNLVSGGTA